MKRCSNKNCIYRGELQFLNNFHKDKYSKDGHASNCKDCKKTYIENNKKEIIKYEHEYYSKNKKRINKQNRKYRRSNKDKIKLVRKQYNKTINGSYSRYKSKSKQRNIPFNLTFEEFSTFYQQPCFYCGAQIETIGIDRIDNSVGYQMDNCVPCCKSHNFLKKDCSMDIARKMISFELKDLIKKWKPII